MISVEFLVLVFIAASISSASTSGAPCERISNDRSFHPHGSPLNTCHMRTTAIDSKDSLITSPRDETVQAFRAFHNKKLKYLPTNLGETFPNLLGLFAYSCSIKELSKESFKGLGKLRYLIIMNNQIEKIADDTFEYIPVVEHIKLSYNKIKRLNGPAFAPLHKLTYVCFVGNECINEEFIDPTSIAEMPRVVSQNCGDQREEGEKLGNRRR